MDWPWPKPTLAHDFFAADRRFAPAFAAFLRQHPDGWRMRRIDHFSPIDLHLAEHRVTLQGRIDATFVEHFFATTDEALVVRPRPRTNDKMTLYLPAARHPKNLLVHYSVRDEGGRALPVRTRMEAASMEALNLIGLLRAGEDKPLGRDETLRLHTLLATLAFQNPFVLEERIEEWTRLKPKRPSFAASVEPLSTADLLSWIVAEGERYRSGLGEPLQKRLEPIVEGLGGEADVPLREARDPDDPDATADPADPLSHYPSVGSLLVHAIRDMVKVLVDLAPVWAGESAKEGPYLRGDLLRAPEHIAEEVALVLTDGLETFGHLLSRRTAEAARAGIFGEERPSAAETEFLSLLDSWWTYLVMTIELGVPFNIKTSEFLPLIGRAFQVPGWCALPARWSRVERLLYLLSDYWEVVWRTEHFYPLFLKDAAAVHVEVEIPNPELRIEPAKFDPPAVSEDPQKLTGRELSGNDVALVAELGGHELLLPVSFAFGSEMRPTERILHVYSSRGLYEAPHRDKYNRFLYLRVPLRLKPAILWGYVFICVAFVAATTFIGVQLWPAIASGDKPRLLTQVVGLAALTIPISLWTTNVQHREPIVHRKLLLPRLLLYSCLFAIILTLIVFGAGEAVRHWVFGERDPSPDAAVQDQLRHFVELILRLLGRRLP